MRGTGDAAGAGDIHQLNTHMCDPAVMFARRGTHKDVQSRSQAGKASLQGSDM